MKSDQNSRYSNAIDVGCVLGLTRLTIRQRFLTSADRYQERCTPLTHDQGDMHMSNSALSSYEGYQTYHIGPNIGYFHAHGHNGRGLTPRELYATQI